MDSAAICAGRSEAALAGHFGTLSCVFDKKPAVCDQSCANIRHIEVTMARLEEWRRSSSLKALIRCEASVLAREPVEACLRKGFLFSLIALASLSTFAHGQTTDVNDVHIQPRE